MKPLIRIAVMAALVVGEQRLRAAVEEGSQTVRVVVYSDFQCPYCRTFAQPVRDLMAQGAEGIRTEIEFRNFPLSFHPDAQLAHQAALAAREQGKFWEMHDLLFANQAALKRDDLLRYAGQLGLNLDRFRKDLDGDSVKKAIERDQAEGAKLGVQGTPTFFVNGNVYSGTRSYEDLKKLVQGEERRQRTLAEITDSLLSKGPADAAVTVEFFADLVSPVARSASYVVDELMSRYPKTVRVQFRNFPLAFHPQAEMAHDAALASARPGHFWEVANYIFDHQESLREQDVVTFAQGLGLDGARFREAIQQHSYAARVEADVADGFKRGVRGSPVIFVNAQRIDGVPSLQQLVEFVDAELAAKRAAPVKKD